MNGVKEVSRATFHDEVLASKMPVLVDFYAPWCGPCRALAPALEAIAANDVGRIKIVKVNVDDDGPLAELYRIQGVPTLMFFRDGKVTESLVGLPSAKVLLAKIDAVAAKAR